MKVSSALLGECLFAKKEPSDGLDKHAVAVICLNSRGREEVVGHMPQSISKVVPLYLSLPHCYLEFDVTGKLVNCDYGLEIPSRFCFLWA